MTMWMQQYRKLLLIGVPSVLLLILLISYVLGGRYVSTDDAYVQAAKAAISSNVSGQVLRIYVRDNQVVRKNQPLFSLDDKPFKIAVENANAKLISTRLQIMSLKATYQQQLANVQAAKLTLNYQQQEYDRQKKLANSGIASQMQLDKANNVLDTAKQQLIAAEQQLANISASLNNDANIAVDQHPIVKQAQAQLDEAKLNLFYTTTVASIDGIVTKVPLLEVGNYINAGAPVFSLVSNKNIWVEANFKETQITYMRPGQKALIKIDAYPDKTFNGHVVSISPGTGSTFSLLPPENATGNWVKVVQRVPVKIALKDINDKVLSAGLSVNVTVDTRHGRLSSADKK